MCSDVISTVTETPHTAVLDFCCVDLLSNRSALEFVWSQESSDYAIRESGGRLKIFKNFAEKATVKIEYAIEGMHGGSLIGEHSCI